MANTKISALTAAATLTGTELLAGVQSAANVKITSEQQRAYGQTLPLALAPPTLTGSAATSSLSIVQTWNTTGTPTALSVAVTDTASNGASKLLSLTVGGTTAISVSKTGTLTFGGLSNAAIGDDAGARVRISLNSSPYVAVASGGYFGMGSTNAQVHDVILQRDAAATLALRNGTTAQTLRWYYSFTDLSNRANGALKTASDQIIIEAETAGTGADNIDVTLTPAGTGAVRFGTHSAVAAELTTGYITIKDAGGTTRKIAVIS